MQPLPIPVRACLLVAPFPVAAGLAVDVEVGFVALLAAAMCVANLSVLAWLGPQLVGAVAAASSAAAPAPSAAAPSDAAPVVPMTDEGVAVPQFGPIASVLVVKFTALLAATAWLCTWSPLGVALGLSTLFLSVGVAVLLEHAQLRRLSLER